MTVGEGIFLSAIFLGLVVLFIATKDRWKWKRIALWFFGGTGLLTALFVGFLYYDSRPKPPEKISEMWDIALGMSPDEVRFRKGNPTRIFDEGPFAEWHYIIEEYSSNYRYVIAFKENKVRYVFYEGPSYEGPRVSGISIGNSQDQLINDLGQPSAISNSKDSLDRLLSFENFNLVAHLRKNQVISFGIYTASDGPLSFVEEKGQPVPPRNLDPVIQPAPEK